VRWENKNACRWPTVSVIIIYAKNCRKWTILTQLIVEDVVTFFLEHSVEWSMVTVCPYYIISEILNGTRMEILVSGIKQRVRVIQNVCGNGWRWAY